ncbi:PREDICTED: cathepsin L-like [Erythranthe guttata]|uniref:cathepsin L-like n=1 Tax=Erythranthe guttata TaxID=4155 RepID=UPI00064DB6F8|nr:PREDICTED: cathepsin L-like [Erythranthe guttata]|eukprot:XP_012851905.1 PREDICTED: cathepsin L-like [Erythranthe guttata]
MEFYGATGTIGLLYAKHKGVSLNSDYPYVGGIQKNHQIPSGPKVRVHKVVAIDDFRRHKVKKIISKGHPVLAYMDVFESFLDFVGPEVYKENYGKYSGSHIVLIVGYGVDAQGYDYWIVQNTWGSDWGDKGFAKVRCGLVSIQSYADGVFLETFVSAALEQFLVTERGSNSLVRELTIFC